jgi:hypothetical protein
MRHKQPRAQNVGVGCQYRYNLGLKDEHRCGRPFTTPAWRYCDLHSESGPNQYKSLLQKKEKYVFYHRLDKGDDEEYRCRKRIYQFLYRHGLIESKLGPLFDHSKIVQEEYPCPDDFHQSILNELNKINGTMLNPPAYLPTIAKDAKSQIFVVVNKLKRQQDVYSYSNPTTNRLTAFALELRRDIGKRVSQRAFTETSGEVKEVLEMWRQQKDIRGFIYALFVYVELNRLKFLAYPHESGFLNKAHRWLAITADICNQAINRCAGTHKQTASLLACCVPLLQTALAFNGNEPENAEDNIQSLDYIGNTVADSYGGTPITETIRFSCLMHQAQFYMYFNKVDRGYEYLTEAEKITSTSIWSSIESQLEVAFVKAGLGLASNDQNRYKNLQEYISLFQRYPFLTHYRYLQSLEKLYSKDIDKSSFTGVPIYFDTMFRRLQPLLLDV